MSVERGIASIVRRHMEALHDDLSDVLGELDDEAPGSRGIVDGYEFAAIVGDEVRAGLMTTGEYVEWFNESVSAK